MALEQLRDRASTLGIRTLNDNELLELILGTGVGSVDGEHQARSLLAGRGLFAVACLPLSETSQLAGIGLGKAIQFSAVVEVGRRLSSFNPEQRTTIASPADAANLLMYEMSMLEQEHLYVILLDTRNRLIGQPVEVYHGSLNTSLIRVGEVFREAIRKNAASIIVVHNHPSGDPAPSPEDVAVTRAIREAGKLLDIDLLDHLVIGHQRFTSLKERGLGFA